MSRLSEIFALALIVNFVLNERIPIFIDFVCHGFGGCDCSRYDQTKVCSYNQVCIEGAPNTPKCIPISNHLEKCESGPCACVKERIGKITKLATCSSSEYCLLHDSPVCAQKIAVGTSCAAEGCVCVHGDAMSDCTKNALCQSFNNQPRCFGSKILNGQTCDKPSRCLCSDLDHPNKNLVCKKGQKCSVGREVFCSDNRLLTEKTEVKI